MKTHTNNFKNQIKLIGKEIDSKITFGETELGKEHLNAVTPSFQSSILKSAMKQLDIDSNVYIPVGSVLKYEFGVKVNGEYEYLDFGNYIVKDIEKLNYYIKQVEERNLSKRQLEKIIKSNEYERLPEETKNKLINKEKSNIKDLIKKANSIYLLASVILIKKCVKSFLLSLIG